VRDPDTVTENSSTVFIKETCCHQANLSLLASRQFFGAKPTTGHFWCAAGTALRHCFGMPTSSFIVRLTLRALADGQLAGTVEAVDTGEQITIRNIHELVAFFQRASGLDDIYQDGTKSVRY
jgi:hypothetical protein